MDDLSNSSLIRQGCGCRWQVGSVSATVSAVNLDMRMMFSLFLYTPQRNGYILDVDDCFWYPKNDKLRVCEQGKTQGVASGTSPYIPRIGHPCSPRCWSILRPCHSLALHALEVGTAPSIWSFREEHAESLGAVGKCTSLDEMYLNWPGSSSRLPSLL